MFISYAQNGEDVWLNRVFEGKNDGFYIDVGAHDHQVDSCTYVFSERGWTGINICFDEKNLDSIKNKRTNDITTLYKDGNVGIEAYLKQYVEDVSFVRIGESNQAHALIQATDWKECRPLVLIVKAASSPIRDIVSQQNLALWHSWEPLLMDAGYVFATFDGLNRYYVRKEDQHFVAKFIIPISTIVDNFQKYTPTPIIVQTEIVTQQPSFKELSRLAARFSYHYRKNTVPSAPIKISLTSKATTQADIDSLWCSYWTDRLKMERIYHRKIWEQSYVPQALFNADMLQKGKRGIVFGCGREPLPALFASMGCSIVATDAPPEIGWKGSTMYADSSENLYFPEIVDRHTFERSVSLQYVDMNNIPEELHGTFDFCWSICALEHLGSLQAGLDFVSNSLKVLKVDGVAVHTTEFNYAHDEQTFESAGNSLYLRKHFEKLIKDLRGKGHSVADPNFDVGNDIFDLYVDTPPYLSDGFEGGGPHLKLDISGFASTCFGLIITKGK